MKEAIISTLREIEQKENVHILLAVESGSRAWGFASPDSDYDVRFIYVRPRDFYLRLDKTRDVIELPIDEVLDINGWDIKKALGLLHSSNPTLFEWLASPVMYWKTAVYDQLNALAPLYFSPKRGLYHYLSMAENNYRTYLKGEQVRAKKYFYVLRPLLACRWILDYGTPPPIRFSDLMENELPEPLVPCVQRLLELKKDIPEIGEIRRVAELNAYFDECIPEIREQAQTAPEGREGDWDRLNTFFLTLLEQSF